MRLRAWLAFTLISMGVTCLCAQDRLRVDAKVNGHPVRLFFDTAATHTILFKKTADRLGLNYEIPPEGDPPSSNSVLAGFSEECEFDLHSVKLNTKFRIYDSPNYLQTDADGVLGWGSLRNNIFWIDAANDSLSTISNVPPRAKTWNQFRVRSDVDILTLEIPRRGVTNTIVLDTGLKGGLSISPTEWRAWKKMHRAQRMTLAARFMPGAGLIIKEEGWADQFAIGSLFLTNLPINEANSVQIGDPSFIAALGLTAIKQMQLVVDGQENIAYLNVTSPPGGEYQHNRLGAVFVPNDPRKDDDLVAHVATDSPAQKAGIQNGDILLKIDDMDVTLWRTTPGIQPFSRFWERPKGTVLYLTLRRGQDSKRVRVELENILGPGLQSTNAQPSD